MSLSRFGIFGIVVMLVIAVAGCATDAATTRAVLDAHANARPTLAVTCPAGGCSVEYTDPRDRGVRLPTNGYDAAIAISGQVTGLIGGAVVPAAMGVVAVEGMRAMRGHGQSSTSSVMTTSTTSDSHDTVTTTTTTTDSTHAPTVVTQPEPVQQPAPTVVHPVVVMP